MTIRIIEDVVPQVAVAAIDIITQKTVPDWNRWAVYGMTILGYTGAFLNWGGPLVKEIGKASLPLTARQLAETFQGGASRQVSSRMAFRPAQRMSGRGIGIPVPASGADAGIIVSST